MDQGTFPSVASAGKLSYANVNKVVLHTTHRRTEAKKNILSNFATQSCTERTDPVKILMPLLTDIIKIINCTVPSVLIHTHLIEIKIPAFIIPKHSHMYLLSLQFSHVLYSGMEIRKDRFIMEIPCMTEE